MLIVIATLVGIGLILVLWIWYQERLPAARLAEGSQAMRVRIGTSFAPASFRARPGLPLTMRFEHDAAGNGDIVAIIFPDFGLERALAANGPTLVTLPPSDERSIVFVARGGAMLGTVEVRATWLERMQGRAGRRREAGGR